MTRAGYAASPRACAGGQLWGLFTLLALIDKIPKVNCSSAKSFMPTTKGIIRNSRKNLGKHRLGSGLPRLAMWKALINICLLSTGVDGVRNLHFGKAMGGKKPYEYAK